jgi:hypothetical protein
MKRPARILLIVVGALFALLLLIVVLAPMLFGDRIAARVKTEINNSVNARVDWRSAGLGLFRDFPNLTLTLDDLTTVGVGKFEKDTLASIRHLHVSLDLFSAIRSALGSSSPVVVRAIALDRPRLSLIALEDGTANWDISKKPAGPKPEAEAAKPMAVSLRRFAIDSGNIAFDNRAAKLKASIQSLDQTLSGDFGAEQVAVETRAHADTVTVEFAGISYLDKVALDLTVDGAADMAKKTLKLEKGGVRLNELVLALTGSVASVGDRLNLDLAFSAPKTEFKDILSLVPAVYANDFRSVKTSGSFAVNGKVRGEYGDSIVPAFTVNAKVDNGTFRYPDLPLPARDIALDLQLTNPGGKADNTVVKLNRLHVVLGQNPVEARMVLRTPLSDPDVDASVKGRVDLADLRRTMKLQNVQQLSGSIAADAAVRTRLSWVDNGQFDRVHASGTVNVRDLAVKSEAFPRPLAIKETTLELGPRRAELKSFDGTVGSSDLRASGYLENFLGYALRDDDLRGSANVSSNKFNLDEWRSDEGELSIIPVPPHVDFSLDAKVRQVLYDKLTMNNARGRLRVKDQRVTLENFAFNTLGGEMAISGYYETTTPTKPTFDVALKMQKLDIPSAFEAFNTVRLLAPVAKYAKGTFSTELKLTGPLGKNMMPLYQALSGQGRISTSKLLVQDFPPFDKLAAATKLNFLENPTLVALRSQFAIRDGRLQIEPFTVGIAGTTMTVAGSNGLDQSLRYDLGLKVPRSLIGGEANQAISGLLSKAAGAGVNLGSAAEIPLGIQLGGTITNPTIKTDLANLPASAAQGATEAVKQAAEQKVNAEAQKLIGEAEKQATGIRAEAQSLADKVKKEGYQQADSLVAKSKDGLAKMAATAAADQLRKETDNKAAQIVREADQKANALVEQAKKQAGAPAAGP